MDIYDETKHTEFYSFSQSSISIVAQRHYILSAPPIFTISDELYIDILKTNMENAKKDFSDAYKKEKLKQLHNIKEQYIEILTNNQVTIEMPYLSKQEFMAHPLSLFDAESFTTQETLYTYEQYQQHIEDTKQYINTFTNSKKTVHNKTDNNEADNKELNGNEIINNESIKLILTNNIAFHNIQIQIVKNHFVIISKIKSPIIHFVLRHPKMVAAMENFKIAKKDTENKESDA